MKHLRKAQDIVLGIEQIDGAPERGASGVVRLLINGIHCDLADVGAPEISSSRHLLHKTSHGLRKFNFKTTDRRELAPFLISDDRGLDTARLFCWS